MQAAGQMRSRAQGVQHHSNKLHRLAAPRLLQPLHRLPSGLIARSTGKLCDLRRHSTTAACAGSPPATKPPLASVEQQHVSLAHVHANGPAASAPGCCSGAAGDAAKDFINDVSKQADAIKDSVSKQADAVKASAAAAVADLKSQVCVGVCVSMARGRWRQPVCVCWYCS